MYLLADNQAALSSTLNRLMDTRSNAQREWDRMRNFVPPGTLPLPKESALHYWKYINGIPTMMTKLPLSRPKP